MHDQSLDHTPEALNPRRAMLAGLGGLAAGAFLASTANAGPLTPPPGPIASTPGPEPRIPINTLPGSSNSVHRILLPGSYYLTGDIVGEPGKSGIQVISLAGEVVIDLNGFTIRGVDGSIVGISCNGTGPRVVIRNGQIRGWGWNGVNATCPMVLEDLRIEGNGQGEATHGGARGGDLIAAQVRRCVFAANNGDGLRVGEGSTVEKCTSQANGRAGMVIGDGSAIRACTVSSNSTDGTILGFRCVVDACTISGNAERGIYSENPLCRITRNLLTDNSEGVRLDNGANNSLVDENSIIGNITGMNVYAQGCTVVRNVGGANSGNNNTFVGGNNVAPFQPAAIATSPWANLL